MKHLLLLACAMPLMAMDNAVIPVSSKLSALSVINKNGHLDYSIADRSVQRCDVYGPLKEISSEKQLSGFLANGGNIRVSKMSNGEYVLRSGVDIKGGGVVLANIMYWGVKAVGYGVPAAAMAGTVAVAAGPLIAAGGVAGGIAGMGAAGSAVVIEAGAAGLAGAGAIATGGATIVGAGVIGAVGVETTALVAGGAIGCAGSGAAYIAMVETGAAAAGAAGLACWFLP